MTVLNAKPFVIALALLALAGCGSTEKLARASGPLFALNPDHWQATPDDLKEPPKADR